METNGITVIERDTMHAIIRAAQSLDEIAEALKVAVKDNPAKPEVDEEEIYRRVRHEHLVKDAMTQCTRYIASRFTEKQINEEIEPNFDFEYLADLFEQNHNNNVADNVQWQELIADYIAANGIPVRTALSTKDIV
jgi:hypothetical protein